MYIRFLTILVIIEIVFLAWQIFDIIYMLDLPKKQCEARGAQIVVQEKLTVCRYVRK